VLKTEAKKNSGAIDNYGIEYADELANFAACLTKIL
jgi:hypothetical protein